MVSINCRDSDFEDIVHTDQLLSLNRTREAVEAPWLVSLLLAR